MFIIRIKVSDKMETIHKICLVFTIVGALNWGLIGFFDFNLVEALFMENEVITRIVYSLVGICGLINIGLLFNHITSNPTK